MKTKIAPIQITPEQIALYLADHPVKRRKGKKVKPESPPEEIAEEFLVNYTSARLLEVLVDSSGNKIDIGWIVRRYIDILDREDTKPAEETAILDRLQSFLVLGAIQDPKLADRVQRKTGISPKGPVAKEHSDPFKGLKIKTG